MLSYFGVSALLDCFLLLIIHSFKPLFPQTASPALTLFFSALVARRYQPEALFGTDKTPL